MWAVSYKVQKTSGPLHVRVYVDQHLSKFFSLQTVKFARFELFTVVLLKIQVLLDAALSLGE